MYQPFKFPAHALIHQQLSPDVLDTFLETIAVVVFSSRSRKVIEFQCAGRREA